MEEVGQEGEKKVGIIKFPQEQSRYEIAELIVGTKIKTRKNHSILSVNVYLSASGEFRKSNIHEIQ